MPYLAAWLPNSNGLHMASPPSLLLGPRPPPPCCRSHSRSVNRHAYKRSARPCSLPRTGRPLLAAAVVQQLSLRWPRGTGATGRLACHCSYDAENGPPMPPPHKEKSLGDEWSVLRRWDVPWEWPIITLTMVACAVSFLLTGMVERSILEQLGYQAADATLDEKAEVLLLGQFSTTVVVLGSIFGITNTFRPFSDDILRYDFKEPFNLQNGWLLWAGIGIFLAIIAIAVAGAAMTFLNGETPHRETDSLVLLLPLIGSSSISTVCLLGITGVLAPVLEETIFRGFLMVSLTMWCCVRIFVCSNSKSPHSYYDTCCLELRSNIVTNPSSAARI